MSTFTQILLSILFLAVLAVVVFYLTQLLAKYMWKLAGIAVERELKKAANQ